MYFTCKKCRESVSCPSLDRKRFEEREWVCDACWTPIFDKKYKVNQRGADVFFSPMSGGLGDRIVSSIIQKQYLRDNPDENVVFAGEFDHMFDLWYGRKNYKKIFWANITNLGKVPDKAIWFSVTSEANAYARAGIYPEWTEFEKPNVELPETYCVMHQRYYSRVDEKNFEPHYAFAIERLLKELQMPTVFVGQDEPLTGDAHPLFIDMRRKLKLPEIAWVIRHAKFFIGKDSGIAHLAGACSDVPLVCFGYRSPPWIPKVHPGRLAAWSDRDTKLENILDKIKEVAA